MRRAIGSLFRKAARSDNSRRKSCSTLPALRRTAPAGRALVFCDSGGDLVNVARPHHQNQVARPASAVSRSVNFSKSGSNSASVWPDALIAFNNAELVTPGIGGSLAA